MMKNASRKIFVIFICYALAYAPLIQAAQLSLPASDLIAPEITQPEYVDKIAPGKDHKISVRVTDNVAVKQVVLYYRVIGSQNYNSKLMKRINNSNNYQASINANEIKKTGIEYYIQAIDTSDNRLLHGYSFSPLSVKTISTGTDIAESNSAVSTPPEDESIFKNKWLWIGLGVLALGAAAGSSSGGDSGTPTATTTSLTFTSPTP